MTKISLRGPEMLRRRRAFLVVQVCGQHILLREKEMMSRLIGMMCLCAGFMLFAGCDPGTAPEGGSGNRDNSAASPGDYE